MLKIIVIIMYIVGILKGNVNLNALRSEENIDKTMSETTETAENTSKNSDRNITEPNSTNNNQGNKEQNKEVDTERNKPNQIQQEPEKNVSEELNNQESEKNENQNNNIEKHPELAFTGYTQRNTSKENTVITWIKDELSKQPDAVEFGFTVQGNIIAKENSTGFTMVENRVRNRVKNSIGGKYYIYVEDHYLYNSDGTEANITDTWVYVYTQY